MNLDNQNAAKSLQLLAAQDRLYLRAKWWTYSLYFATVIPIVAYFAKTYFPKIDEWISIIGIMGLFLVFVLDHHIKNKIKQAGLIQEEFDLSIYEWDWNKQLGEEKMLKDERIRAAEGYKIDESRLPWYSAIIGSLSDKQAQILLCQRENVVWDWQIKQKFGVVFCWFFFLIIIFLFAWGYFQDISFREWLTVNLLVVSGFLFKNFELWRSFSKTGMIQKSISDNIHAEIESYKQSKTISKEKLRLLQNQIYQYRLENCLVPDWFFKLFKQKFQLRTTASTQEIVEEIKNV